MDRELDQVFTESEIWNDKCLFVCRDDGVVIYFNNKLGTEVDAQSLGGLASGLWQAAFTLSSSTVNEDMGSFRLSMDTSSSGIYIIPLSLGDHDGFLGLIFKDDKIPAVAKNKLRIKKFEIEQSSLLKFEKKESTEMLFNNITESEIEEAFSF